MKNKLHDIKKTKVDTIATFFMKISQLKDQLLSIGETIDDEELVSTALNGLPTSWESYIQGISAQENQPSFDRLWTNCVQEEGRVLTRSNPQNEENQALATHARKAKGRRFPYKKDKGRRHAPVHERKKRDLSQFRCYNCQKLCHFADKCPEKKKKGKQHV